MQTLYEYDFRESAEAPLDQKAILERNLSEFSDAIDDKQFVHDVVDGVKKEQQRIDDVIGPAAPEWPGFGCTRYG